MGPEVCALLVALWLKGDEGQGSPSPGLAAAASPGKTDKVAEDGLSPVVGAAVRQVYLQLKTPLPYPPAPARFDPIFRRPAALVSRQYSVGGHGVPWDRGLALTGYLRSVAWAESGFNPRARSASSSAAGLYQFTRSTWLATLKQHGAQGGMALAASKIGEDLNGRPRVANPEDENLILALRGDPSIASAMAASLTNDNAVRLSRVLGRPPSKGELYAAHVLGWKGAAMLVLSLPRWGGLPAPFIFPSAAAHNRSLFYSARGPRSLSDLYAGFSRKMDP